MTNIESQLDAVLLREGGYVNHPNDRGGPTNFGITQRTLSAWLGRPATAEDVQAMDAATAKDIYRRNFYTGPGLDRLPPLIQPVMLDGAVNSGPGQSIKWLQQVLNDNNYGPLSVDGGIGPKTVAAAVAAADAMGVALNKGLVEARRAFLMALVTRDPSQSCFQKGWMNRCDALEAEYCA